MSKKPDFIPIGEPCPSNPAFGLEPDLNERLAASLPVVDYDALTDMYSELGLEPSEHKITAMDNELVWHSRRRRIQQIGIHRPEPFMQSVINGAVRLAEAELKPDYYINAKRNNMTFTAAMASTFAASIAFKSPEIFGATAVTSFGGAIACEMLWDDTVEPARRILQESLYAKYGEAIVFNAIPPKTSSLIVRH